MRVKSEERRQAIIEVAREAFTRQGFETTSMSEIASRVGGSKATLYNYFRSKEELFAAVMEDFGKQKIADAFMSLNAEHEIKEELQRLGMQYLNFVLNPEVMALRTVALHEASRSPISRQYYEEGPKRGWLMVASYLQKLVERQKLKCEDVWICAQHLKALLEAELVEPCSLCIEPQPDTDTLERVVRRAVRVFLAAYGNN
jgi:Transcriptional regulator